MANNQLIKSLEYAGKVFLRRWKQFWHWLNTPKLKEKISYIGVVLYADDQKKLFGLFNPPSDWKHFAHHMTICLGDGRKNLPPLGTEFYLVVHALRRDDFGICVDVIPICPDYPEFAMHIGQPPHITIAVAQDKKPNYSLKLIKEAYGAPVFPLLLSGRLCAIIFTKKILPFYDNLAKNGA